MFPLHLLFSVKIFQETGRSYEMYLAAGWSLCYSLLVVATYVNVLCHRNKTQSSIENKPLLHREEDEQDIEALSIQSVV